MAQKTISAFVISDLHAYDKAQTKGDGPSFFEISEPAGSSQNPISALEELITQEKIRADMLICCGDFCDKAHPNAMGFAWKSVNELQKILHATVLIATAGNHDIDSRYQYNEFDAKGYIQTLSPLFPIGREPLANKFWARHFFTLIDPNYNIVVLNSSAYHGISGKTDSSGKPELPPEYQHGRISKHTLDQLRKELTNLSRKPINILVCHHHPLKHSGVNFVEDYQQMTNGGDLLRILEAANCGEWLVFHGHLHFPRISIATGTTQTPPIIFSAGSLCAKLSGDQAAVCRNQCYLVEFPLNEIRKMGLVGTFRAWDWAPGGWTPATDKSGLPRKGGFGARMHDNQLTKEVKRFVPRRKLVRWNDLETRIPSLRYLQPGALARFIEKLRENGFKINIDNGAPDIIQRTKS